MKDFKKSSEKEKMPRLLSLSIWHKGAWHEIILAENFRQGSQEDNLEEIDNLPTEKVLN